MRYRHHKVDRQKFLNTAQAERKGSEDRKNEATQNMETCRMKISSPEIQWNFTRTFF